MVVSGCLGVATQSFDINLVFLVSFIVHVAGDLSDCVVGNSFSLLSVGGVLSFVDGIFLGE